MAKAKTEKSKYPSPSSPGQFVTGAQYIVELICLKKAKADGVTLPVRFWRLETWAKYFGYQSVVANSLLKKYSERAIIRALNDRRSYKTYSLRAPFLLKIIKEKQVEEDAQKAPVKTDYNENTVTSKPRPPKKKRSVLGALMEIDNGEKEGS